MEVIKISRELLWAKSDTATGTNPGKEFSSDILIEIRA